MMYLKMLLGHFLVMTQGITGAIVPTRKKKRRAMKRVSTLPSPFAGDLLTAVASS